LCVQLVSRYAAQFGLDARQLQAEVAQVFDEEYGKTFDELMDKYLADFTQEVRCLISMDI
jgi:predicted PolB exonuclease-like 3'-5' exonuclease